MQIGEVSRRSGVSVRMLRHYDSLGLVSPRSRTTAGYREYANADLRRILQVEALRSLGMGLAEAAAALDGVDQEGVDQEGADQDGSDRADVHGPSDILDALIDRTRARIAAEHELLTRLEHTRARSPGDWEDVLDTVALLRAVRSDDPRARHDAALAPDTLPAAAFAEAALTEDEPNVAGTLRWAAGQAAGNAAAVLTAAEEALRAYDPARRLRAVQLLGDQFQHDHAAADDPENSATAREAAALLTSVLTDADAEVRARAALTLASRPRGRTTAHAEVSGASDGVDEAASRRPSERRLRDQLVQMIVDGTKDVEAAEALARLAADGEPAVQGAAASAAVDAIRVRLHDRTTPAAGRVRLAQAMGELPGPAIRPVLALLMGDDDPDVARVATYLVRRADGA